MNGNNTRNPSKQEELFAANSSVDQENFEGVEFNSAYRNVSAYIQKNPSKFVETKFLKKYISSVSSAVLRSRVGNFFISTESTIFKEQMAEYLASQVSKNDALKEYIVITPAFQSEENLFNIDFATIFEELINEGIYKIILFIDDFEKKCTPDEYSSFFGLIKKLKETLEFEDIKIIATTSLKELEFDDSYYYNSEFKYDLISLLEPEVEEFKSILNFKVQELSEFHGIKISSAVYNYYNLMYIVQCVDNYDMSCYLDGLDYAFAIAKFDNRKCVRKSDINNAFGLYVFDDVSISNDELLNTCYHEAGHYVVGRVLFKDKFCLKAISCILNARSFGITCARIKFIESFKTLEQQKKYNAYILGGQIAEELLGKPISIGSEDDFKEVKKDSRDWLLKGGDNSNLGKYCYYSRKKMSSKTFEVLEEETKKLITESAELCKKVLKENVTLLHQVAKELFDKKLLSKNDVERLYQKYSKK